MNAHKINCTYKVQVTSQKSKSEGITHTYAPRPRSLGGHPKHSGLEPASLEG